MNKLHPGAKWLFRFRAYWILIFFVLIIVFVLGSSLMGTFFEIEGNVLSIVIFSVSAYLILVLLLAEIFARMSYNRWFYEVTDNGIRIEKGIIWKKYTSLPFERVQNVDIHRGIMARLFGFSTLDIHTAGYSGGYGRRGRRQRSEGHIPAVSITEAEELRKSIMDKVSKGSGGGGL